MRSPRPIDLTLAGLPRPRGGSAGARRTAIARETDDQIGARLYRMLRPLQALDDAALDGLARAIDLPLGELVASPFGLRMIALGARLGVRSVRHETRAMLPARGVWDHGVLVTGKYDAFRQDDPLVAYHPEHVSKWAAHEFLHRAVGFFERASASRFERYVGARLNEILPVGTWYGLEHALRRDNDGDRFDAVREGLDPSAWIHQATWRVDPPARLRARCVRAAPRVRWTLSHAQRELEAIDRELAEGRIATAHHAEEPHLDASSDAMAYAIAHDARLRSGPVREVLRAYAGRSRFTQLRALRSSVESTLDALLFEPLMIDLRAIRKAQEVRRAWDLASRVAHAAPQHFSAIERHVRARSDVGALSRVIVKLPGGAQILRTGDAEHVDIAQLDRGLLQAAPRARAHLGRALVARFATSRELEGRGSLPARFAVFLEKAGAPDWLVELAVLESWIIAARRSDPSVESLLARGPLPRRGDPFITASNAFTLVQFATDVLSVHAGREPRTRRTLLLVGKVDGAVSLVSLDVETANAWARLHRRTARLSEWAREVPRARDVLGALAAHGAVGWTRG